MQTNCNLPSAEHQQHADSQLGIVSSASVHKRLSQYTTLQSNQIYIQEVKFDTDIAHRIQP